MSRYYGHFWVDLVPILSCALTGLVLSFLSLYFDAVHRRANVRLAGKLAFHRGHGRIEGFGFIWDGSFGSTVGMCCFSRWNCFTGSAIGLPIRWRMGIIAFPLLFATFLFIAYVMLYALTHLQQR